MINNEEHKHELPKTAADTSFMKQQFIYGWKLF